MAISIQLKRGPSTNLGNISPKDGEIVWLTDEKRFRIGSDDGTTQAWNALNYAQLDVTTGVVPATQLPIDDTAGTGDTDKLWSADKILSTLTSGAQYKGLWQADGSAGPGTPALADGSGNNGDFYIVEVGGDASFDGGTTIITFKEGDRILYEESLGKWQKVVSPDSVDSVNGQTGVVVLGITDINDVSVDSASLADGDYLTWDATAGNWVNVPRIIFINDLIDVDTSTNPPSTDQVLSWNGTQWVPGNSTINYLNDIGDVQIGEIADGDLLAWDGTNQVWVNRPDVYTTYISLTDTPSSYTDNGGLIARVANDESGMVFSGLALEELSNVASGFPPSNGATVVWDDNASSYTIGYQMLIYLDDVNIQGPTDNQVLYYDEANSFWANTSLATITNTSVNLGDLQNVDMGDTGETTGDILQYNGTSWTPVALDSVSATTFLDLTDTPTDYTGNAGKFTQVNSTEDGLVFTDYTLANLIDVDVSGAAKGDILSYNSLTGLWEPAPDSDTTYTAGLGISIDDTNNNAINLDASIDLLTDVDTTTTAPNTDDLLSWDGTNWVPTSLDGGTF